MKTSYSACNTSASIITQQSYKCAKHRSYLPTISRRTPSKATRTASLSVVSTPIVDCLLLRLLHKASAPRAAEAATAVLRRFDSSFQDQIAMDLARMLLVLIAIIAVLAGAGLALALGNMTYFAAANEGDIGVVSVLGAMSPLVTALLAVIFLRERLARLEVTAFGIVLVGTVLVAL